MSPDSHRFQLDFNSFACRIRVEGTKPGKFVRVLVKDTQNPQAPLLHGSGVLAEDLSVFTATFACDGSEQRLVRDWPGLRAELAGYPHYD